MPTDWLEKIKESFGDAWDYFAGSKDSLTTTPGDSKYDPLSGSALLTPASRGPYILGVDKKLYAPLLSGGIDRSGGWIPYGNPTSQLVTNAEAVIGSSGTYIKILAAAQTNAVACNLNIKADASVLSYVKTAAAQYFTVCGSDMGLPEIIPGGFSLCVSNQINSWYITYQVMRWQAGP